MRWLQFGLAAFLAMAATGLADEPAAGAGIPVGSQVVVKLDSGGEVRGVVINQTAKQMVVRAKYGTIGIDRGDIADVKVLPKADAPAPGNRSSRLPAWAPCIDALASRPCGKDLRQIPATVIDTGILKYVPYMSHRAGDFEFNIYGDAEAPAGIEIGIVKDAPKTDAAKAECQSVILALLTDPKDRETLKQLGFATGKTTREGLTFEITPPTADDAYGGWWMSIYGEAALDKARAKPEELAEITRNEANAEADAKKKDPYAWKPKDYKEARPPQPPSPGASPRSTPPPRTVYARGGRCDGSSPCGACTDCSRCAHCKQGGRCGTCSR